MVRQRGDERNGETVLRWFNLNIMKEWRKIGMLKEYTRGSVWKVVQWVNQKKGIDSMNYLKKKGLDAEQARRMVHDKN